MSEIDSTTEEQSAEIETDEAQAATPEVEEVETTDETEDSGDDTPAKKEEAEKAKKHNPFQKRINTKTRLAREAEQRAQEAEQRAAQYEARIKQLEGDPGQYPRLEDFDYDQDKHQQAVIEYTAKMTRQSVHSAQAEQERYLAQLATQNAQKAVVDSFQERSNAFADTHPDYVATVSNPNIPLGRTITQAIVLAENGPDIAYHLGKNPELAYEINSLPAPLAMMRIGQLSAQLSTPVKPKTTSAPAPAKLPSGSGKVDKDPDKMTPTEYAKWRGYRK